MGVWLPWKEKVNSKLYLLLVPFLVFINCGNSLQLYGFKKSYANNEDVVSDEVSIYSQTNTTLRLFGSDFTSEDIRIALVEKAMDFGAICDDEKSSKVFYLKEVFNHTALVTVNHKVSEKKTFYFCLKASDNARFIHQGVAPWLSVDIILKPPVKSQSSLPLPLQIIFICVLLILSGLFSGLNLGLMSLDPMELQIVMKSGTKSEQKYASIIYPIRKKGNFLLCTLLLGNVLVNNTLTILLNEIIAGLLAVIGSTAGIVIMGEIVPQALCSRYGLHVGAYTIWLTKLFMVLTFVVSYPISKILDLILGKEIGTVYNRSKLLEMLKVTDPYNDLDKDEVNIIQGALELRSKTVEDVMTPIDDCFMVELSSILDFETMREIMQTGYTRIPVYDGERSNVVSILFVKDLAFVDPDDCMPLKTVCKFYQHPLNFVFSDITLDKLLEEFKTGTYHMAIVHHVRNEGPGDPFYEMVGIITLEDVIEEIIKSEIVDETDVYTDNRKKKLNMARQKIPIDLSLFAEQPEGGRKPVVTPQILLAAHRFLLAEVEPFKVLSDKVILRLLKQDVVVVLNFNESEPNSDKMFIYRKNKLSDYFVLVLEGQVRVIVGKECLEFQGGPFSYYGVHALLSPSAPPSTSLPPKYPHNRTNSLTRSSAPHHVPQEGAPDNSLPQSTTGKSLVEANPSFPQSFHPDYDIIAASDVKYVKITRSQYIHAVRATRMAEAGNVQEEDATNVEVAIVARNSSKKSVTSGADSMGNRNMNNRYETSSDNGHEKYDISQSHPDLAPPRRHRAPHIRLQNKSMSSGQLMALAAKYATVAGDRVHPSTLIRPIISNEKGDLQSIKQEPSDGGDRDKEMPPDKGASTSYNAPEGSFPNGDEDRTLLE